MPVKDGNVNVPAGTGFWNNAKPVQYSKETQELMRAMMQESRLTNFQQRQIQERLQCGDALPTQCHPTSSNMGQKKTIVKIQRTNVPIQSSRPSLRPAEKCRAGDAYSRDTFHPRPTRDLNKEKSRLQNIMATGSEPPEPKHVAPQREDPVEERDRFDELVAEIQERCGFLAEMESLGRGKEYSNMINTEISQMLREMEVIDKKKSSELRDTLHYTAITNPN